ncbi:hypothetical protein FZEAL_3734 [Fusarium zealandicum]|uniref:HNH nuclease domain-containing protein n=1 Tax=Fusarium zealandicum TaxID=1053134 RepID=A0A8H4UNL7_9HYPO|nr:hypothetical protein FZEAL_3734 [Fusarium zealandicum]
MPLNLRSRFSDTSRCGDRNVIESPDIIRIFHPGYRKTPIASSSCPLIRDALISLPAFDDGGIDYDTAHTACGILVGNRWDGYFSLGRDGSSRVERPADGILRERAYFFFLDSYSDMTQPYPVVPRFRDWRFPHRNLPPCWQKLRSRFREGAHNSVRRCILTDCALSLDTAHLVPVKESAWYDENGMVDYGKAASFSTGAVNASTNLVPLRTDVHRMFDERNFCFIPKSHHRKERSQISSTQRGGDKPASTGHSGNQDGESEQVHSREHTEASTTEQQHNADPTTSLQEDVLIVGHVFNSIPGGELQALWHNREAFSGVYAASIECLFARFAWTIFSPNVFRDFLFMAKESRLLLVWDEDSGQYSTEMVEPAKCKLTLRAARARSESPTKRQRPTGDEGQETLEELQDYYNNASSDVDSGYHGKQFQPGGDDFGLYVSSSEEEEPERGRSRKRKHDGGDQGVFGAINKRRGTKRISGE